MPFVDYKNVQVASPDPTGDAGLVLNSNFRALADATSRSQQATLIFSTTLATDASVARVFDVTVTANFTLSNPTNANDGDAIMWRIKQGSGGSHAMTLGSEFRLPASGPASLILSTVVGTTDILAAIYNAAADKFDVVSFVTGYL